MTKVTILDMGNNNLHLNILVDLQRFSQGQYKLKNSIMYCGTIISTAYT